MPTREHAPVEPPAGSTSPRRTRAEPGLLPPTLRLGRRRTPRSPGHSTYAKDGVPVAGCMASRPDAQWPDCGPCTWPRRRPQNSGVAVADAAGHRLRRGRRGPRCDGRGDDPGGAAIGVWPPGLRHGSVSTPSSAPRSGSRWSPGTTSPSWPSPATSSTGGPAPGMIARLPLHRPRPRREPAGRHRRRHDLPRRGQPSHWSVVFAVEDADASLQTIVELGGTVLAPAAAPPRPPGTDSARPRPFQGGGRSP